jgi:phosphoglycolate phosphatase-like HAD superfamily hydrolase
VVEKVRSLLASPVQPVIVTTKEGRFVSQLLQQQDVQMPEEWIIGKESKRPKHQIIRELIERTGTSLSLWFVEDRLKTLQLVQQQLNLDAVKLYLADWGYNTPSERETARYDPRIQLLSLSQFAQDFSAWP